MLTHKNLGRLGRFGNQCFTVAGVIGIAVRNKHNYCFPKWMNWDALEKFGTTEDIEVYNHLANPLPEFREVPYQHVWIDWGYRPYTFPINACYDLSGHMQSESYFKHCIQLVRHFLTFKDEPEQNGYCAIHYRAGDYTHGSDTYHPRQSADYYQRAMERIPGNYIVFSDDPREARNVIGSNADYVEGNDYLTDFKLMKKCKSFIGANSSFSLMAAILADHPEKQMVFPALWFGDAAGGLSTKDLYPENSIII
jgi:hypothetical protein